MASREVAGVRIAVFSAQMMAKFFYFGLKLDALLRWEGKMMPVQIGLKRSHDAQRFSHALRTNTPVQFRPGGADKKSCALYISSYKISPNFIDVAHAGFRACYRPSLFALPEIYEQQFTAEMTRFVPI